MHMKPGFWAHIRPHKLPAVSSSLHALASGHVVVWGPMRKDLTAWLPSQDGPQAIIDDRRLLGFFVWATISNAKDLSDRS